MSSSQPSRTPLLQLHDVRVEFPDGASKVVAVDGVDVSLHAGETLGLVGESGCGKSTLAMSILGLLPSQAQISGKIVFENKELRSAGEKYLQGVRTGRIGMVFQDPMTSLTPHMRVGVQVAEALVFHRKISLKEALKQTQALLAEVGIDSARMNSFPHEFSGGQRQRIMLAMALSCDPSLVIADEPTTALDAVVQTQVLQLLAAEQAQRGMALILVSHNLGVIAKTCQNIAVMYAGRIVEAGPCKEVLQDPRHPYTRALIQSLPRGIKTQEELRSIAGVPPRLLDSWKGCAFAPRCDCGGGLCADQVPGLIPVPGAARLVRCHSGGQVQTEVPQKSEDVPVAVKPDAEPVLIVKDCTIGYQKEGWFSSTKNAVVQNVSLRVASGEVLAVVGGSGCGKSTLARGICRLLPIDRGSVILSGQDITHLSGQALRRARRYLQMIFQDPGASLDPRIAAIDLVAAPLVDFEGLSWREARRQAAPLFEDVGLDPASGHRYPHEFSGGQRQRLAIARALAGKPRLIICDEPISSLDVSVQAQIINLLARLRSRHGLSLLFIAHDLAVVRHLADRVAVMHRGELVELGSSETVFANPQHQSTRELLAASLEIPR